jgi:hypothetical protein
VSKPTKDYNNVDWSEHFYLDSSSPSGLRWNRDVFQGFKKTPRYSIGDPVGTLNKEKLIGKPRAWQAGIYRKTFYTHRIVWCMVHGSIDPCLMVDHIDGDVSNNSIENLRLVTSKENQMNARLSKNNKSGVNGVYFLINNSNNQYWVASWCDEQSKTCSKHFPIAAYGSEEAFRLACEYRTAQIKLLNENGANYTVRHGSA